MSTPIETAAEAIRGAQGAGAWHTYQEQQDQARAVLASLAQHCDDIARVLCYPAAVTPPSDAPVCEPHRHQVDAVLAYLTGGAS